MKKLFFKPGFEFIFALSLMAILGLPPVLLAQNQKDIEINIHNGDTIINGKNIKDLSPADRQNALNDIKHVNSAPNQNVYFFKRTDSAGKGEQLTFRKRPDDYWIRRGYIAENKIKVDSAGNLIKMKPSMDMTVRKDFDGMPGRGPRRFERRNTQNFDYVSTDSEGVSTRVRFHVSDITNDDLKKMPYVEGGRFEPGDLTLVPEFSSGKTLLMFELPAKAPVTVKLIDGEGKTLWDDKAVNGTFSKLFVMGLNGAYYLQIKQGRNVAVKKIMKEE
jgi:hypothetical protein